MSHRRDMGHPAGLETRGTADLEIGATFGSGDRRYSIGIFWWN
jgi:hypothetical protein